MRKTAYSTAAVVVAVALLTLGAPTPSQAFTQKELSLCYQNTTPNPVLDLELVADGPSYKTASLDAGDCAAWDVRPGQYKITFEDFDDLGAGAAGQTQCPQENAELVITIKRMHEAYKVFVYSVVDNGAFSTDVKKNRLTSVTFLVRCSTASG